MRNVLARSFGAAVLFSVACGSEGSPGPTVTDGGTMGNDANALPSCDILCPAVVAARCPQGPQSQNECVSGCQSIRASSCADKYLALYECGGALPVYACDTQGRTIVVGCESFSAALYACAMMGV